MIGDGDSGLNTRVVKKKENGRQRGTLGIVTSMNSNSRNSRVSPMGIKAQRASMGFFYIMRFTELVVGSFVSCPRVRRFFAQYIILSLKLGFSLLFSFFLACVLRGFQEPLLALCSSDAV